MTTTTEVYGLFAPKIDFDWRVSRGKSDDSGFSLDGQDIGIFGARKQRQISFEGVVIHLKQATREIKQHYEEGEEEIEATDCVVTLPNRPDKPIVLDWCTKLQISFPSDEPGKINITYQKRKSHWGGVEEEQTKVVQYA